MAEGTCSACPWSSVNNNITMSGHWSTMVSIDPEETNNGMANKRGSGWLSPVSMSVSKQMLPAYSVYWSNFFLYIKKGKKLMLSQSKHQYGGQKLQKPM